MCLGHDLYLFGSRDVIGDVTIRLHYVISYIGTPLQLTLYDLYLQRISKYWGSNVSGARPWPFWVTWRHRSRDHSIPYIRFPISAPMELTLYLKWILRYWDSNALGSQPWPFWVRWRHRWRHHWTPTMWIPIGVPLILTLYLEAFSWY